MTNSEPSPRTGGQGSRCGWCVAPRGGASANTLPKRETATTASTRWEPGVPEVEEVLMGPTLHLHYQLRPGWSNLVFACGLQCYIVTGGSEQQQRDCFGDPPQRRKQYRSLARPVWTVIIQRCIITTGYWTGHMAAHFFWPLEVLQQKHP